LNDSGDYSLKRTDGWQMGLFEVLRLSGLLEDVDQAIEAVEKGKHE